MKQLVFYSAYVSMQVLCIFLHSGIYKEQFLHSELINKATSCISVHSLTIIFTKASFQITITETKSPVNLVLDHQAHESCVKGIVFETSQMQHRCFNMPSLSITILICVLFNNTVSSSDYTVSACPLPMTRSKLCECGICKAILI
jgi:predicted membrane protein